MTKKSELLGTEDKGEERRDVFFWGIGACGFLLGCATLLLLPWTFFAGAPNWAEPFWFGLLVSCLLWGLLAFDQVYNQSAPIAPKSIRWIVLLLPLLLSIWFWLFR